MTRDNPSEVAAQSHGYRSRFRWLWTDCRSAFATKAERQIRPTRNPLLSK